MSPIAKISLYHSLLPTAFETADMQDMGTRNQVAFTIGIN